MTDKKRTDKNGGLHKSVKQPAQTRKTAIKKARKNEQKNGRLKKSEKKKGVDSYD